jgi:hypothetical protein
MPGRSESWAGHGQKNFLESVNLLPGYNVIDNDRRRDAE